MSLVELCKANVLVADTALSDLSKVVIDPKLAPAAFATPVWVEIKNNNLSQLLISSASHLEQLASVRSYLVSVLSKSIHSSEELHIILSRSNTYIEESTSALSDIRLICTKGIKRIDSQIQYSISVIVKLIYNTPTEQSIDTDAIDVVLNLSDLELSFKLMRALMYKSFISLDVKQYALDVLDRKCKVLMGIPASASIAYDTSELKNVLQRFNLVPDECRVRSLASVIESMFGISSKVDIRSLGDAIGAISDKEQKRVGLIIIHTPGKQVYFDLSTLLRPGSVSEVKKETGISKSYIDLFNTLIVDNTSSVSTGTSTLMCFGVEEALKTNGNVYILWSYNLSEYRCRSVPLSASQVRGVLRNRASFLINNYNHDLESSVHTQRNEEIEYEYKKVNYYSFLDIPSETEVLDGIASDIKTYLETKLSESSTVLEFVSSVNSDAFTTDICSITKKHKPVKNDTRKEMAILDTVYLTDTISILKKLKKELIDTSNKMLDASKSTYATYLPDIIDYAVKPNSNIYNKFISAYYLTKLTL